MLIGDGIIFVEINECLNCGSRNILKENDLVVCLDCEEEFAEIYEFQNPRACSHCGYQDDCLERFRFCPFDGKDANEKLMSSFRKKRL